MDKPGEKALNPSHEKKRGASRDSKGVDDTDIGCQKYGVGNVREQMPGLWSIPSEEVVGLPPTRILTNDYCKKTGKEKPDLLEEILTNGPPLLNISKPRRIF